MSSERTFLVYADRGFTPKGETSAFSLDYAYGYADNGENDYSLKFHDGTRLTQGDVWWIDSTPYCGVVDTVKDDDGTATYSGRNLAGLFASHIVAPRPEEDYRTVDVTAANAASALLNLFGLSDFFIAENSPNIKAFSYQFPRFTDCWTCLMGLCAANSIKPVFKCVNNKVMFHLEPIGELDVTNDDAALKIDVTSKRPVNHLYVGTRKPTSPWVFEYFVDADGAVVDSQQFKGRDEVAGYYELDTSGITPQEQYKKHETQLSYADKRIQAAQRNLDKAKANLAEVRKRKPSGRKAATIAKSRALLQRQVANAVNRVNNAQEALDNAKQWKDAYEKKLDDMYADKYTSVDDKATDKIISLQDGGSVTVTVKDGRADGMSLLDAVTGLDVFTHNTVTSYVSKRVVKVVDGMMSVETTVGALPGSSLKDGSLSSSSAAGGGAGGVEYTAGKGVTITGGVISAEVSKAEQDSTARTAAQAAADARNALTYIDNAKLTMGAVSTLPPGSLATASLSGAGLNQSLSLGIPEGRPSPGLNVRNLIPRPRFSQVDATYWRASGSGRSVSTIQDVSPDGVQDQLLIIDPGASSASYGAVARDNVTLQPDQYVWSVWVKPSMDGSVYMQAAHSGSVDYAPLTAQVKKDQWVRLETQGAIPAGSHSIGYIYSQTAGMTLELWHPMLCTLREWKLLQAAGIDYWDDEQATRGERDMLVGDGPFRLISHRGGTGFPEQSIDGCRWAVLHGYIPEVDVRLLADGTPVLCHDDTISRTMTRINGATETVVNKIRDLKAWDNDYMQRPAVNGGQTGVSPTLERLLQACGNQGILNIEVKQLDEPTLERTMSLISLYGCKSSVILASFDVTLMAIAKSQGYTTMCFAGNQDELNRVLAAPIRPDYCGVHYSLCTAETSRLLAGKGVRMTAWTVDRAADYEACKTAGAVMVTSNRPDYLTDRTPRTSRILQDGLCTLPVPYSETSLSKQYPFTSRHGYFSTGDGFGFAGSGVAGQGSYAVIEPFSEHRLNLLNDGAYDLVVHGMAGRMLDGGQGANGSFIRVILFQYDRNDEHWLDGPGAKAVQFFVRRNGECCTYTRSGGAFTQTGSTWIGGHNSGSPWHGQGDSLFYDLRVSFHNGSLTFNLTSGADQAAASHDYRMSLDGRIKVAFALNQYDTISWVRASSNLIIDTNYGTGRPS